MRNHYPKLCNMTHTPSLECFIAFKGPNVYILYYFLYFVSIAADFVPSGSPKKFPHTSSIGHIIYYFWSFVISGCILII